MTAMTGHDVTPVAGGLDELNQQLRDVRGRDRRERLTTILRQIGVQMNGDNISSSYFNRMRAQAFGEQTLTEIIGKAIGYANGLLDENFRPVGGSPSN